MLELGEALAHPLERRRQLPELVLARILDGLAEIASGDPVGGTLETPDPLRENRRGEIPDEQRRPEGDQAGDYQAPADEVDTLERVTKRHPKEHHRPAEDRVGDLGVSLAAHGNRAALLAGGREGSRHQRIVLDVRRGDGIRVCVDRQLRRREREHPEVDDAGVRAVVRLLYRVVERERRAVQTLKTTWPCRLMLTLRLRVIQVAFQRSTAGLP